MLLFCLFMISFDDDPYATDDVVQLRLLISFGFK